MERTREKETESKRDGDNENREGGDWPARRIRRAKKRGVVTISPSFPLKSVKVWRFISRRNTGELAWEEMLLKRAGRRH